MTCLKLREKSHAVCVKNSSTTRRKPIHRPYAPHVESALNWTNARVDGVSEPANSSQLNLRGEAI